MNMLSRVDVSDDIVQDEAPPRRWRRAMWIGLPLLAAGTSYVVLNGNMRTPVAPPAPVVTVATPLQRDIKEWDDYVGRFEASRTVEVRPRVSGAITALHFTDGQIVHAGQPLFTIDPRPYQAALAEAQAGVATARSELALAHADLDRASRLIDIDGVSKSEIDRLRARVQAGSAGLAAAQARVRARALDVEFTTVRAPIGGRVSDRRVDAGNLVAAGEGAGSTLLTTINALDPIYFSFQGSEALFLKAKRNGTSTGAPVEIRLQDEAGYRWTGKLDFTDNGLDPRSGTIRARAILSNPHLFLTPGMFGNMRLSDGGTAHALLVPDTAVQTDQTRKTLLVVARDNKVSVKPVILGPVIDGLRVIESGLKPADRVVIVGTQMAIPGSTVQPRAGTIEPVAEQAAVPSGMALRGEATFAR